MRLLICAGGTGGGVYPVMAVSEKLTEAGHEILWVGSEGGMEATLVRRKDIPFKAIPAAGLHGISISKVPGNLMKLVRGYKASRQIIKEFKPDAMLYSGGYIAAPMALAARGIKSLVYVPDLEPGLALKYISKMATKIAVSVEETKRFFNDPEKVEVSGYPLRKSFTKWNKEDGINFFKFENSRPILLFLGGSLGARSINTALANNAEELIQDFNIIHITGMLDWDMVWEKTKHLGGNYVAFNYLHEIGPAEAAADLVISRAGASCLGEYPYMGLPAILVPYPHAWHYQKMNADYLANRHAAVILEDARLEEELLPLIRSLFSEKNKLSLMAEAMASLRDDDAAGYVARMILKMVEGIDD